MNNSFIEKGNIAITEYMEVEKIDESYLTPGRLRTVYLFNGHWVPVRKLKYHLAWDWLMPVIEKISKTRLLNALGNESTDPQDVCYPRTFGMPSEDGTRVMFRFNGYVSHEAETLIEAAYLAVVDFIDTTFEKNNSDEPKC